MPATMATTRDTIKPLVWMGSSKADLVVLPATVQSLFGYALHVAQAGKKHDQAKPLRTR